MKLKITINEKVFEVDVEAVEPEVAPVLTNARVVESAPVRLPAAPGPAAAVDEQPVNEAKVCRSPVSGVVVRVVAQVGQSLQEGDVLLVLEAMKMETNITAPVAGKVASIKMAQGEGVQAGQVVVEFE